MDWTLLVEYSWVLLVLIALEGLLAADNAMVLAILVRHLPEKQRKKALFYGLAGAFVFRLSSLFAISLLINIWQIQALGAVYLLFIAINFLARKYARHYVYKHRQEGTNGTEKQQKKGSGFWMTVLKVELADIAFAVDSILAAVAIAVTLPSTPLPQIGGIDGGQFLVIFAGGFVGLIIMRFAATIFVKLLQRKPGLETAAYLIVGWVGVKLAVFTLSHPDIGLLPEHIEEMQAWKVTFYAVLVAIAVGGWFFSKDVGKTGQATMSDTTDDADKTDDAQKTDERGITDGLATRHDRKATHDHGRHAANPVQPEMAATKDDDQTDSEVYRN